MTKKPAIDFDTEMVADEILGMVRAFKRGFISEQQLRAGIEISIQIIVAETKIKILKEAFEHETSKHTV